MPAQSCKEKGGELARQTVDITHGNDVDKTWEARRAKCYHPVYALAAVLDPRYLDRREIDGADYVLGTDLVEALLGRAQAAGVKALISQWKRDPALSLKRDKEVVQVSSLAFNDVGIELVDIVVLSYCLLVCFT